MPNEEKLKVLAEELGLIGVVEEDGIVKAAKQAIDENPKAVEDYNNGQKFN